MKLKEENKINNALRFYFLATRLKDKIRSGWDYNHWNIKADRLESVAEHVYGTCILAIAIDSEFDFDINIEKVIKMLVVHEVGEVLIGDITPFDNVTPEKKEEIEHQAVCKMFNGLIKKEELIDLVFEFDEKKTKEAQFAFYCDKLEADLQSKSYFDRGYHHDLNDQDNNVVVKNDKVVKMIENGAKDAYDIWYLWDKPVYKDSEVFTKILEYVKNNDSTKIIKKYEEK